MAEGFSSFEGGSAGKKFATTSTHTWSLLRWRFHSKHFLPPNSCFPKKERYQIIIKRGHETRFRRRNKIKLFDTTRLKGWREAKLCLTNQNETLRLSSCSCFGGWKWQFIKSVGERKRIRKRRKAIACENMFLSSSSVFEGSNCQGDNHEREEGAIFHFFHAICIRWHHLLREKSINFDEDNSRKGLSRGRQIFHNNQRRPLRSQANFSVSSRLEIIKALHNAGVVMFSSRAPLQLPPLQL